MTLKDIVDKLEGFAEAAWKRIEDEAIRIEQEVEPVVESAFAAAVEQFGELAVNTVTKLMTEEFANLSGTAKLNLTATTIVDAAEQQGKAIAAADATALAKNAYTAVMGKAPAAGETLVQESAEIAEKVAGDVTNSST